MVGVFLVVVLGSGLTALASSGLVPVFTRSEPSSAAPLEVRFDASSSRNPSGSVVVYQWSFGDGFLGSGETAVHRYAADGSYVVKLVMDVGQDPPAVFQGLIHVSGPAEVFPLGTGVGQAAPTFELPDLNGVPVRIADFRGRVVLLDFWATWCPTCKTTLSILEDFRKQYQDKGLVVVGVTTDKNVNEPATYLSANGFSNFTCLWGSLDAARAVQALYEVTGIPHVFVIDRIGVIRFNGKPEQLTDADIQPWP